MELDSPSCCSQSNEDEQAGEGGGDEDGDSSFWDIIAGSHMKLESYSDQPYDQEMTEPVPSFMSSTAPPLSTSMSFASSPVPLTNLPEYEDFGTLPSLMCSQVSYPGLGPSHLVTFEPRRDGTPFPLSKPIVREDGFLLVGTEIVADALSSSTREKNRIFVTNFLTSAAPTQPPAHILVEDEVRDARWIGPRAAVLAIGKEIQVIQLGDLSMGGSCRMQAPINAVHADTIRELAVSPTTTSYVVSGGFDETVVLTDLRAQGDPQAAAIIGKYNASDVVSSVRWAPLESQLSWTTDGGDFQVADIRVHSPQLQVPLYTYQNLTAFGGLFSHEYLGPYNIALGFQYGHIAFVDTRMPRHNFCTSTIESKLGGTGEICRYKTDKFAIFGYGGFSTAYMDGTATSLDQVILQQHRTLSSYKTSGDFSYERGLYLAVSDNTGTVSVYTDDTVFGSSTSFHGSTAAGGW
ncbi:unnamed protein product [Hyaloperonospora brassicae]|uniref:Uncharacterized protein n=1 Tax=Hyaloperonospora brassicae TaxID=162125 RepID=A0AAV0T939_HYABA|nr:unnamed protein product [Hyaloperonospora brassicae]